MFYEMVGWVWEKMWVWVKSWCVPLIVPEFSKSELGNLDVSQCLMIEWFFSIKLVLHPPPQFDMLMYPDCLQNWLDFGHGLLIFLIFVMTASGFCANLTGLW